MEPNLRQFHIPQPRLLISSRLCCSESGFSSGVVRLCLVRCGVGARDSGRLLSVDRSERTGLSIVGTVEMLPAQRRIDAVILGEDASGIATL